MLTKTDIKITRSPFLTSLFVLFVYFFVLADVGL